MATKIFGATATDGSAEGALDSILEATISDGDFAIVTDSSEETYVYRYEASNDNDTNPESVPQVITPDDNQDPGDTGAWILTDISMEDLKVYGNAVFDGTVTIGSISLSSNIDIAGALSFDGGTGVTSIEADLDQVFADHTSLISCKAAKAYIDSEVSGITVSYDFFAGYLIRPMFTYESTTSITITDFRYHHDGTSEQIVKNDTTLTYVFESGGSNASSDDFGTSEWHYLYIDDSAVVAKGTAVISETELINCTTAPTWSASKGGWYGTGVGVATTNDRCIGAFYVDSGGDLAEFWHDGSKEIGVSVIGIMSETNVGTGYSKAVSYRAPSFCQMVVAMIKGRPNNNVSVAYLFSRPDGSTVVGQRVGHAYRDGGDTRVWTSFNTVHIHTDSSQATEIACSTVDPDAKWTIWQEGWFLPRGM